jgi:hypothetical protein
MSASTTAQAPVGVRSLTGPIPVLVALFLLTRGAAVAGMLIARHFNVGETVAALSGAYDAGWYQRIVAGGYGPTTWDYPLAAFYPGYPMLVKAVYGPLAWLAQLLGPSLGGLAPVKPWLLPASMLLVSNVSLVVGMAALWKLYQPLLGETATVLGIGLLLSAPGAFFLSSGFTESTFVAETALAFLAAARGRWELAGLAAAAAALTRWSGALLLVPLALAWWESPARRLSPALGAGLAVFAAAVLAYPLYLWRTFGDPLFYVRLQAHGWPHRPSNPLELIAVILRGGYRGLRALLGLSRTVNPVEAPVLVADAGMVTWSLVALVLGKLRLPLSHLAWIALVLFPPLATGVSESMNRYLLGAWPIFFLAGWWLRRWPALAVIVMAASSFWMLLLARLIALGYAVG